MRRMAASKFGKSPFESDRGRQSLAPARRRGLRPSQRIGRPPRRRYRLGLRPLPLLLQSRVFRGGKLPKRKLKYFACFVAV